MRICVRFELPFNLSLRLRVFILQPQHLFFENILGEGCSLCSTFVVVSLGEIFLSKILYTTECGSLLYVDRFYVRRLSS